MSTNRENAPRRPGAEIPISRRVFAGAALATLFACTRSGETPPSSAPRPSGAPSSPLRSSPEPSPDPEPTGEPPEPAPDPLTDSAPREAQVLPLFREHPALKTKLPHVALGDFPTPVERLTELGDHLGIAALYVKRDDISGELYGGGKTRKLEFLLADAKRAGARTVVTFGGAGSNHGVATAAYARRLGLKTRLLLLPEPSTDHVRENLLLDHSFGAELRLSPRRAQAEAAARRGSARDAPGETPYVIARGGSSLLGHIGFVNAAFELKDQIDLGEMPEPDWLYIAMGTMGGAVGLSLGLKAAGLKTRVVAVRASSPDTSSEARMRTMFDETADALRGLDPAFPRLRFRDAGVLLAGGYLGEGYARPTRKSANAIDVARRRAGLGLEHTYTGKAFAALLDDAPKLSDQVVLFWNTHNSRVMDVSGVDFRDLPREFHFYFTGRGRDAPTR